jgi:hypothetical protein
MEVQWPKKKQTLTTPFTCQQLKIGSRKLASLMERLKVRKVSSCCGRNSVRILSKRLKRKIILSHKRLWLLCKNTPMRKLTPCEDRKMKSSNITARKLREPSDLKTEPRINKARLPKQHQSCKLSRRVSAKVGLKLSISDLSSLILLKT